MREIGKNTKLAQGTDLTQEQFLEITSKPAGDYGWWEFPLFFAGFKLSTTSWDESEGGDGITYWLLSYEDGWQQCSDQKSLISAIKEKLKSKKRSAESGLEAINGI